MYSALLLSRMDISGFFFEVGGGREVSFILFLCYVLHPQVKIFSLYFVGGQISDSTIPEVIWTRQAHHLWLFLYYFLLHDKLFPFIEGNSRLVYCSVFLVPETLFQ